MIRRLPNRFRADAACAAGLTLLTLALYAATLQPDLGGPEDTPKFQFLGSVLGTAHPPGYPLYSVLSYVFVTLVPIGSIAYRANLFSAVMMALACGLAYLVTRGIGAGRSAAIVTTVGLATGVNLWRNAVFAEVYGLAAANTAAIVFLLMAWRRRRSPWILIAAIAAVALAAGNQLVVLGLIPAALGFVLLVDRRAATARVVAAGLALTLLAVAQYGFIVLRTRQGAVYLESRAWSLTDLYAVVTAERYADSRFAFTWHDLLFLQLPAAASAVVQDLGRVGALLFVIGVVVAIRRRSWDALLALGAAAGLLAFIVNLKGDVSGFVTPLLVLVWPIAGLGLQALAETLNAARFVVGIERRQPGAARLLRANAGSVAILATLAAVVVKAVPTYAASNQRRNTAEAEYFRTFYSALPAGAAVVAENYTVDMAVQYLMFTGEAGPAKDVTRLAFSGREVRQAAADKRRVFALRDGATFLAAEGLRFEPAAIGTPLDAWLASLPRGSLIVGASANTAFPIEALGRLRVSAPPSGRGRPYTMFGVVTGSSDLTWKVEDRPISVLVDEGLLEVPVPRLGNPLEVSVDDDGARIMLGDRSIASVNRGVVIAAFDGAGRLLRGLRLAPGDPLAVPLEPGVYEYRAASPCVELAPGAWTDLSSLSVLSGSWVTTLTEFGSVRLETETDGSALSVSELTGTGEAKVISAKVISQIATAPASMTGRVIAELTRPHIRRVLFRMVLDDGPGPARVRVEGSRRPLTVCAHIPAPPARDSNGIAALPLDVGGEAYFGGGWTRPEPSEGGLVRRATVPSTILLPLDPASHRISLDAAAAAGLWFTIEMNGRPIGECEFSGRQPCRLEVDRTHLRPGVNRLTIRLSRPAQTLPAASLVLRGIDLEHLDRAAVNGR